MFVDKTVIKVVAGQGGKGCCSFRREAFIPKGGPNGGDGGDGGNVILITAPGEQSLVEMYYTRHHMAQNGEPGKGKDMHGKNGKHLYLKVPIGTVATDLETGEIIADMDTVGKEVIIARGGKGGLGNARFATSTNRAPRHTEPGTPGEEKEIELELKTIADIGLVGYPNAGKSTLINALTNAKPKVAPYPFTTLHPVVGIIEYPDFHKITLADIPGLIEGAHENRGLGHEFLRHIERTRMLVYVLDTAGVDGRDPLDDFKSLQKELELYQKGLSKRPSIVLANKCDLPESAENLEMLKKKLPKKYQVLPVSAGLGEGLEGLPELFREKIEKIKKK